MRWRQLPATVRIAANQGCERIRVMRDEMIRASPVGWMPPVRIYPIGWATEDGPAFGTSRPIRLRGLWYSSALLPVSTVYCVREDKVLRGILVHEFSHCFYEMFAFIKAIMAGETSYIVGIPPEKMGDPEYDATRMVKPEEWFGKDDAQVLIQHDDPAFDPPSEFFLSHWVDAGLPLETPSWGEVGGFNVPGSVLKHVKDLLERGHQES
jgi:hypothetical protein